MTVKNRIFQVQSSVSGGLGHALESSAFKR